MAGQVRPRRRALAALHASRVEALAALFEDGPPRLRQPGGVTLDLDSDDAALTFQDEIDLDIVLIAVVADQRWVRRKRRLLLKLRIDEPLEQVSKSASV